MSLAVRLGRGVTDTHMHVYDGRFPTAPNAVVLPPDALAEEYLAQVVNPLGVERVVVVQPTAYGLDDRCQTGAMESFRAAGLDVRGVMVVDANTPPDELGRLDRLGVRGARFHMLPGGAVGWDHLEPVADAIAPLGWHVQLQMDGRQFAVELVDRLLALRCPVVVDHVGRFMPPVPPGHDAFAALTALLDGGRSWVKLSAPYESRDRPPDFPGVTALVDELVRLHPDRLLWGSNWPHPGQDAPLSADALTLLIERWLPDTDLRRRVLVEHPAELYGF